jgi:hypothetical protein
MGPGQVIALVFGVLLLLPAFGLLLGGGVLLWADKVERNDDGFLFTAEDAFSTDGYALASEQIDLSTGADWVPLSAALGTARIEVSAADPDQGIFIGIAPLADGARYLDGVEHSVVADLGLDNPAQAVVPGGAPSGPPADETFWVAESSGTGTQQVSWVPEDGAWMFVVMNDDAASGVAFDARIGATAPALDGLAWGLLAGGAVLLVVGCVLILVAARRRPAASGPYPGAQLPAGPPPYWTPPPPVDRITAADAGPGAQTPTGAPPQAPPG